jgi:hypothetical protein
MLYNRLNEQRHLTEVMAEFETCDVLYPAHNPDDESDEDNSSEDTADIHTNLR